MRTITTLSAATALLSFLAAATTHESKGSGLESQEKVKGQAYTL